MSWHAGVRGCLTWYTHAWQTVVSSSGQLMVNKQTWATVRLVHCFVGKHPCNLEGYPETWFMVVGANMHPSGWKMVIVRVR